MFGLDRTTQLVAATLLIASANASAQQTNKRVLEEVIVTAQKTEQSSQDVPISLTAVDGEFMKDIGATNLQDIAAYIPNLRFSSDTDPALAQINIRGFGTNPLNAAFESSVGFVQDDMFFGRPSYFAESMFDVARVEVLRGPQGTLFGKNTVAGVFNTTSAGPTEEFSGDIRISDADPEERRIEAGAGAMLTDWFGLRLSMLDFDRNGELDNTKLNKNFDQYRQRAQRGKFLFLPTDDLEFELTAVKSKTKSSYWQLQLHLLDDDTRDFLDDYDPQVEGDPFNHQLSQNEDGFLDKGSDTYIGKVTWNVGDLFGLSDFTTTVILGDTELYIDSAVDLDASPAAIASLPVRSDYEQQSAELRFTGTSENGLFGLGERLEFVAGVYWFTSRFEQRVNIVMGEDFGAYLNTQDAAQLASGDPNFNQPLADAPGPLRDAAALLVTNGAGEDRYQLDYLLDVDALAWFGQFTWFITEQWAVTPGIRFNSEEKKADAAGKGVCAAKQTGGPCVLETALSANDYDAPGLTRDESDVSPKLSVQYFWGEDLTLFATWAKGFKSGGFNGSSFTGDDLVFEEEKAQTFEIGAKGKFLDNTLSANLTLFQTKFENLQVLAFNGAFFDVTNAASATAEGLEFDFQWLTPLEFLTLNGSLGILDATYDEYSNAPAPVSNGINTTQDLSGKTVALAPKQSASLTPSVMFPIGDSLGIQAAVDFLYQGEQFSDTDLDPVTKIDANTTISARISIGAQDRSWAVSLGASNLTDKEIANQILDTVFFPQTYNVTQKGGRKVFLAVTASW